MKKSIKKLLVLSQVLGWSALVATACTDDQVTKNQTTANRANNKDQANNTKPNDNSDKNPDIKNTGDGANKGEPNSVKNNENGKKESGKAIEPPKAKTNEKSQTEQTNVNGHNTESEHSPRTEDHSEETTTTTTPGNKDSVQPSGQEEAGPSPSAPASSSTGPTHSDTGKSGETVEPSSDGMKKVKE